MQFINATTTESAEDVAAALRHYGMEPEVETIEAGLPAEKKEATKESSKPGEADEKPTKEATVENPESKTEAELETAERAEQQDDEKLPDAEMAKRRNKKLLKQIDGLTGKWRTEEGKTKQLEAQVAELRKQITELGEKEPAPVEAREQTEAEPEGPKKPERPKRPKLAEMDWDQNAFEAALDTYENESLPKYEDDLNQWTKTEAIREFRAQQAQEQRDAEWNAALGEYDGLHQRMADSEAQVSRAMEAVLKATYTPKEAAAIINYLADHPDESQAISEKTVATKAQPNAAEWAFLSSVATRELSRIDARLQKAEPSKATAPKAEPSKQPPAKPKPPVSAAPAPIDPVNTRTSTAGSKSPDEMSPAEYATWRRQSMAAARR